jgi:hypothetical protein
MNKSGSVPVSISKYKYNPGFALVTKKKQDAPPELVIGTKVISDPFLCST